jgi:DNA-binding beta-propeller fold protein YncE
MRSPTLVSLALFAAPCWAGDELLVSAYNSDSVTRFDATSGAVLGQLGAGGQNGILGAAIGPDGALYVCSELTDSIKRYDAVDGSYLGEFVFDDPTTVPDETGGLDAPSSIVFGPNDHAFVGAFNIDAILEYDGRTGAFLRRLVNPGQNSLNRGCSTRGRSCSAARRCS